MIINPNFLARNATAINIQMRQPANGQFYQKNLALESAETPTTTTAKAANPKI